MAWDNITNLRKVVFWVSNSHFQVQHRGPLFVISEGQLKLVFGVSLRSLLGWSQGLGLYISGCRPSSRCRKYQGTSSRYYEESIGRLSGCLKDQTGLPGICTDHSEFRNQFSIHHLPQFRWDYRLLGDPDRWNTWLHGSDLRFIIF